VVKMSVYDKLAIEKRTDGNRKDFFHEFLFKRWFRSVTDG